MKSEPVEGEALRAMCKYIRTPKHPEDEFKCVLEPDQNDCRSEERRVGKECLE